MDRRCRVCEGRATVYETWTFGGWPWLHRYRCGCGTRFDHVTRLGEVLASTCALLIPGATVLLPNEKFVRASERWPILALTCLLSLGLVLVVAHSRRTTRANPPL